MIQRCESTVWFLDQHELRSRQYDHAVTIGERHQNRRDRICSDIGARGSRQTRVEIGAFGTAASREPVFFGEGGRPAFGE
jgi:hypothetical protein